jgi:lipoprotein-anchoring transpeptidase ErfK/SrfK
VSFATAWSIAIGLITPVGSRQIDGITFGNSQTLYAPVREVVTALGLRLGSDGKHVSLNGKQITEEHRLVTGEHLVPIRNLKTIGVNITASGKSIIATFETKQLLVTRGRKHTIVDKDRQLLKAYQGKRLVLLAHVGTGREGHRTPNGNFKAGPKERMHRSRLYHFAPMPWSVPIKHDIFIHGYDAAAKVPPSHGCIRLATGGPNPARWFYEWVSAGSEVTVQGRWSR